jgi:hypothetical protein
MISPSAAKLIVGLQQSIPRCKDADFEVRTAIGEEIAACMKVPDDLCYIDLDASDTETVTANLHSEWRLLKSNGSLAVYLDKSLVNVTIDNNRDCSPIALECAKHYPIKGLIE